MDQQANGAMRSDASDDPALSNDLLSANADDGQALALADEMGETEVATLLHAWHSAAGRLEEAHRAKCAEAKRLREELDARNADLAQRHRLADFGAAVARIAREMQDRFGAVERHLDLLERRLVNDSGGRELIEKVVTDLAAWEASLSDLLTFAADRPPESDVLSVRELVDGARMALSHQLTHQAVHVVVDVPEEARATGDEQLLQRAIINVVLQALDRVPPGGEVVVAAAQRREATELEIVCGSAFAQRGEQGHPAKANPAAAVLRWALVQHILEQHGGEVVAKGDALGGMSYLMRLPHHRLEPSH